MVFEIRRTSSFLRDDKPCEEAFRHTFLYTQEFRYGSFAEYNKSVMGQLNGPFESVGVNHRHSSDGHIARDMLKEGWAIEINSLEELINFKHRIGSSIIISDDNLADENYEIEIYDDWRE